MRLRCLIVLLFGLCAVSVSASAVPMPEDGLTELVAQNGELDVTLQAAAGPIHIGDLTLPGASYNGHYAGPVLRVHPGDLLRVNLVNHLAEPTNIHFHGMRSSPLGNGDNMHLSVAPGGSFVYEIRVPEDQPPGVYWYHSHLHYKSEAQVMAGLTGTLIVDPPTPPASDQPAERLFVLKDMTFDDDIGNAEVDDDLHGIVQSINGTLMTREAMRTGETQLWRFTNQSANLPFHIALPGHTFRIVAEDGAATLIPRTTDVLDIMPAARVDVLVDAGAPGTYAVLSKGTLTGVGTGRQSDRTLGELVVSETDDAVASTQPSTPTPRPEVPPRDLRFITPDATRSVVFTETSSFDPDKQKFFVNGTTFDADRVDVRVPLGNIEEWTLRNDTDDLHVFHIHQLGFQIVEVNGNPMPFDGHVDTVRVPEHGDVKIRLAFTDPLIVGRFVFHCHVLRHEDHGMMAQIEVYDPSESWMKRFSLVYLHVWWWLHGVPWSQCGLATA